MQRARQVIYLVASLIALSILLMVLDGRDMLDPVKGLAGGLVTPVSRALTDAGSGVNSSGNGDGEIAQQLEDVTQERDQLMAENARLRELVVEIDQLRSQLGFQQAHPELTAVTAGVIGRDPEGIEKVIVIDRGSNDGIEVGMPVVSPDFLVGEVTEVDQNRSRVMLMIDAGFQTGARLQVSRGTGIVYGLWQAGGRAEMRHIPIDTEVNPDEVIVTSGRSLMIPEGLIIGKILEIHRDELGSEITLSVLPLVDFDSLETVTVITGEQEPGE
ncbi:MAG: rod shape-determining protein MreC [Thermomicrobiales bacterium]